MKFEMFDDTFLRQLEEFIGDADVTLFRNCLLFAREISIIGERLVKSDFLFKSCLVRATKVVKEIEKRNDEGNSSLRWVTAEELNILNDAIEYMRKLISDSNDMVNGIDVTGCQIPQNIILLFESYNHVLSQIKGVIPLSCLKAIGSIINDEAKNKSFHFVCKYRKDMKALLSDIERFKDGIDAFNEWIHDMGHYLVQIDKILPSRNNNNVQMMEENVHRLDALLDGVRLLKIGLRMSLHGDDIMGSFKEEQNYHSYEPYKVFHKLRYCFVEKDIIWDDGQSAFWGKVLYAPGIEFVAMNLYSNAVKYLAKFPGEKRIITRFTQCEDGVEIIVESYGPIVTEDELEKISYSIYRASSVCAYRGSGRGLCRVRKICEAAGYRFSINVKRDKGWNDKFMPFVVRILIPKEFQITLPSHSTWE